MKRLVSNHEAKMALVGRTIVAVDLDIVEEDEGDDSSGIPKITLDNGVVVTFDVDDYGSGTYGINVELRSEDA